MILNFTWGFWVHKDLDLDAPLYRIIDLKYIFDLLNNNRLYFRRVTDWEDPWEIPSRFLQTNLKEHIKGGLASKIVSANLSARYSYGNCWTKIIDSDAMWRIYSVAKNGIGLQTTARKLFSSIDLSFGESDPIFASGFLGPVRYEQLNVDPTCSPFFDQTADEYPYYLLPSFIKRKAFEHEHEVRFLIYDPNAGNNSGIYLPLKNLNFIDQLILDPRLNEQEVHMYQEMFNFYKIKVSQSTLYKVPEEIFQVIQDPKLFEQNQPKGAWLWHNNDFTKLGNWGKT